MTQQRMPAETQPHTRTFMAWPASPAIWGNDLPAVRRNIASIARAIAQYEPVVLLARPDQSAAAQQACGSSVQVIPIPVDDLWIRDTGPTFVLGDGLAGVDFNFNGWGNKQQHANDAKVARALLAYYGLPRIQAPIVAEGGALETDGLGTLMATESSIVNDNRNPGKSRDQIERALKAALGLQKVIWFDGVKGEDVTDSHVDALARFSAPGVVILDRPAPGSRPDVWSKQSDQALSVLKIATDARGKPLTVVELREPDPSKIRAKTNSDDFLASYVNYYVANGAVFVPQFGDKSADDAAKGTLGDQFPGRDIVQLDIDDLAAGDGGIHCATQQQAQTPGGDSAAEANG